METQDVSARVAEVRAEVERVLTERAERRRRIGLERWQADGVYTGPVRSERTGDVQMLNLWWRGQPEAGPYDTDSSPGEAFLRENWRALVRYVRFPYTWDDAAAEANLAWLEHRSMWDAVRGMNGNNPHRLARFGEVEAFDAVVAMSQDHGRHTSSDADATHPDTDVATGNEPFAGLSGERAVDPGDRAADRRPVDLDDLVTLTERQRQIAAMVLGVDGPTMTEVEVAAELGITQQAVSDAVHKAAARLYRRPNPNRERPVDAYTGNPDRLRLENKHRAPGPTAPAPHHLAERRYGPDTWQPKTVEYVEVSWSGGKTYEISRWEHDRPGDPDGKGVPTVPWDGEWHESWTGNRHNLGVRRPYEASERHKALLLAGLKCLFPPD